jgi:hypothetical protein
MSPTKCGRTCKGNDPNGAFTPIRRNLELIRGFWERSFP